jgi:MFS family permease
MSGVPDTTGEGAATRSRSLFRHPDFLKLWSAETVSQFGTAITQLALPLTAILILKATAFQVGLLTTAQFLPFILVGLPAGVWVDRLRRRPLLIVGDLGRAVVLASIPIAYELGHLHMVHLYVAAFLVGVLTVFFDVAYMSYLPSLVDRDQLVDGNSKLEISRSAAALGGPGLAGGLIQILTAPVAILFDSISYLWSAGFVFWIRRTELPVPRLQGEQEHPSMMREIREGLRYVLRHRMLLPIALTTASSNLFTTMAQAILILFAVRQLGLSAGVIGLIFAIGNVGFLIGAFVAQPIARRFGVGPTIIGSAFLFGPPAILIAMATPSSAVVLLIVSGVVMGLSGVTYNINQVSLRQAITPERMQGRMNATMRFMVWGTMPIGAIVGGALGGTIGLRPTLWVSAIGSLFCFVPLLFSPLPSLREIPVEPPSAAAEDPLAAAEDGVVVSDHLPRVTLATEEDVQAPAGPSPVG